MGQQGLAAAETFLKLGLAFLREGTVAGGMMIIYNRLSYIE